MGDPALTKSLAEPTTVLHARNPVELAGFAAMEAKHREDDVSEPTPSGNSDSTSEESPVLGSLLCGSFYRLARGSAQAESS